MKTEIKLKLAFALSMGVVTTGIISFTLISANIGYTEHFAQIWLRSWGMAYCVVIPAILFIGPKIQNLLTRVIK
jgi:hypothetical protein